MQNRSPKPTTKQHIQKWFLTDTHGYGADAICQPVGWGTNCTKGKLLASCASWRGGRSRQRPRIAVLKALGDCSGDSPHPILSALITCRHPAIVRAAPAGALSAQGWGQVGYKMALMSLPSPVALRQRQRQAEVRRHITSILSPQWNNSHMAPMSLIKGPVLTLNPCCP